MQPLYCDAINPFTALPAGVVAVAPGALDRIFALVADIKASTGYTQPIGIDLGLIGAEQGAPDMSIIRPELSPKLQGNAVFIGWGRLRKTRNSPRQKTRTRYTRPMRPKSTQDSQPDRENAPFSESPTIRLWKISSRIAGS